MEPKQHLIELLRSKPKDSSILSLIQTTESHSIINLERDLSLLNGVWELRWSSSNQPWLKQAGWLENLQILDSEKMKAINLLRARGVFGSLAVVAVEADVTINGSNQIGIKFKQGGWLGPSLNGGWRPKLLKKINQGFPAWLDITVIDNNLRICRGNAGTCFALLKRDDLSVTDWIPASTERATE